MLKLSSFKPAPVVYSYFTYISYVSKAKNVRNTDGLNKFISSAAGEKLSAILTIDYLKARAKKGKRADFDKILKKGPAKGPLD